MPDEDHNIPWLFTTATDAPGETGDDDHLQIIYYLIPENYDGKIYLWIEDPGCTDSNDHIPDPTESPEDLFTTFSWLIENEMGEDISFPFSVITHIK